MSILGNSSRAESAILILIDKCNNVSYQITINDLMSVQLLSIENRKCLMMYVIGKFTYSYEITMYFFGSLLNDEIFFSNCFIYMNIYLLKLLSPSHT